MRERMAGTMGVKAKQKVGQFGGKSSFKRKPVETEDEEPDETEDEETDDEEPAPKSKKSPAKKAGRKSRFAGLGGGEERDPLLEVGRYRLRVISTTLEPSPKDDREWFKAKVEVVESSGSTATEVGSICGVIACFATKPGKAEMFRFIRAAAGCADDDAYFEEFGTEGEHIDACLDEDSPIEGAEFDAVVSKGGETQDGDWYRNYRFTPAGESDDETDDEPAPAKKSAKKARG